MRGSLKCPLKFSAVRGIIPAHAGLTGILLRKRMSKRDHPRACGAHSNRLPMILTIVGSSPRMRGSPQSSVKYNRARGIIPAHAGLTLFVVCGVSRKRDHPRACGAHLSYTSCNSVMVGSSPRMRGSLRTVQQAMTLSGIIPAHAGLTIQLSNRLHSVGDHPRACGAHLLDNLSIRWRRGSSPRMRGSPLGKE